MVASNISPSATYRVIEEFKPTLLIDEADKQFAMNSELQNIVNAGHTKRMAYVVRSASKEKNFKPERFDVFCPKVVAMIGRPIYTWIDRSIEIIMERKPKDICREKIPFNFYEKKQILRQKLLKWTNNLNAPEVLEG